MYCIQAINLTKIFNSLVAVKNLNLELRKGEIFGLVGPDASGKTTTLRMLCGLLATDQGEIRISGVDIRKDGNRFKEKIGYLPQRFGLYGDLTVIENINFYADIYKIPKKIKEEKVERLLKVANLDPFKRRKAQDLSGGMKQKLGLICALIHTPEILMLDEPTTGIDPLSRRDFWMILYELIKEGVTILFSTSYIDEAERCNRIAMIYQGELLATDTPSSIKSMIKEIVLELRTDNNQKMMKSLEGIDLLKNLVLSGDKIHIFVCESIDGEKLIQEITKNEGLKIMSLKRVRPSMEDAFVYMVRKKKEG